MESKPQPIESLRRYDVHLRATGEWCLLSISRGRGGSCAHYSPLFGWSKPYPETTGYLIPTLFALNERLEDERYRDAALAVGQWLLDIQRSDGAWHGGLHPSDEQRASVFNTGQILEGLSTLYHKTGREEFLEAGVQGARWLANGVDNRGFWPNSDYKSTKTPSYYTHVAWPMLEIAAVTGDSLVSEAAIRHLEMVRTRVNDNGVIELWGFGEGDAAFTHTIAYTIRGFQESARLLGDYDGYARLVEPALEVLYRKAELTSGRLPGAFHEDWKPAAKYVCLTGNLQLAHCLLLLEARDPDLRLVNAACKLIDYVVSVQRLRTPFRSVNGAVAGSHPFWGKYMMGRYPNWAAKYLCDALMSLTDRLRAEVPM